MLSARGGAAAPVPGVLRDPVRRGTAQGAARTTKVDNYGWPEVCCSPGERRAEPCKRWITPRLPWITMCTAHAQGVHNGAACYTRPVHNPHTRLPTATWELSTRLHSSGDAPRHPAKTVRPVNNFFGCGCRGRPRLLGIPRDSLDRYGGAAPRALTLTALTCPKEAD